MKEVTIRIYDGNDPSVVDAVDKRSKINFFDLVIDDEVYSNMKHLILDIRAPEKDENGTLFVDNTAVSMTIEKDFC